MTALRLTTVYVALISSLSGCAADDFPKYVLLDRLRVLALTSSEPETSPGSTVAIEPWLSDINGAGRSLVFSAEACADPGVRIGADPSCAGNPTRQEIAVDAPVTGLAAPNYTGAAGAFNVVIPAEAVVFAGRSAADRFNGVGWLVVYSVRSTDAKSVVRTYRRIVVTPAASAQPKNTNPTITEIRAGSAPLTALPSSETKISAFVSGAESYSVLSPQGAKLPRREELVTTWFISDGDLDVYRTQGGDETKWTPPATAPSGRNVLVIGVTRDGRSGVAVRSVTL